MLLGPAAAGAGAVYETESEFLATGDFDGDGRGDVVIVDKETGVYRLAYRNPGGELSWVAARAGGVESVEGVAVGPILAIGRDALAMTSPVANRVNVLEAGNPNSPAPPSPVFLSPIGPHLVVAVDIGGVGNTGHADLYIGSKWNGAAKPYAESLVRCTGGGAFSEISSGPLPTPISQGRAVRLQAAGPLHLAVIVHDTENLLGIFHLGTGSVSAVAKAGELAPDTRYLSDFFGGTSLTRFLFYLPGKTELQVRAVTEPAPGTFDFAPAKSFDLGFEIQFIESLPAAPSPNLLVIGDSGAAAYVYEFDGANPPSLIQKIAAPPGADYSGAFPLGNGDFLALTGNNGISQEYRTYHLDGDKYVLQNQGTLPELTPYSAPANVFLFRNEPFVDTIPGLVQSLNAADWTSQPTLSGGPPKDVEVEVEHFVDSTHGLDNPTPRTIGTAPAIANFSLANQYLDSISMQSFLPAVGEQIVEIQISPSPGLQKTGIQVILSPTPAGASVFYRLADKTDWQAYSAPFYLFRDTTVWYYGTPGGSTPKSPIRKAVYTFEKDPDSLDSDEDGVPDYVELGEGLDPLAGDDTDGDGFSDRHELVAGTDPDDATDHPPASDRLEEQAAFDLVLSPHPYDGTLPGATLSAANTPVRAYDLQGSLLASGSTTNLGLPGIDDPAAPLESLAVDIDQRLVATATEPHFDIVTANPDTRLGRQLLKLVAVPVLMPGLEVAYTYEGGEPATEADAWIAAAQAAAAASTRVTVADGMDIFDTLTALLVERQIALVLRDRGVIDPSAGISLFSFRPGDAERIVPTQNELLALESRVSDALPGYSLVHILETLAGGVASPPGPAPARLVALTEEIYRISSALNNDQPGTFPPPVDVLREFLATESLDPAYQAETSFGAADLDEAAAGVAQLLALVTQRPTQTFDLYVTENSFTSACTTLETLIGDKKDLFYADGSPYLFPASFQLLAGSRVRVFGYTDLGPSVCGGDGIEVIEITLESLPEPTSLDSDGDLLPDDFECAFLGGLDGDPYADTDGDGITDLQEFFDGSDPLDSQAAADGPADVSPPVITISLDPGADGIDLAWSWPPEYAPFVEFIVVFSDELGTNFVELPVDATPDAEGHYQVSFPFDSELQKFYQFYLRLK